VSFRAPFFRYDDLRQRAEAFLARYHFERTIPVPIEQIVDVQLQMDIVPVPGLQNAYNTVAFISRDLQTICVDDFVYRARPNRYRFSLAHELGHRILHAKVFQDLAFDDIASWKEVVSDAIPEDQYRYLEFHAYAFAGLILVPPVEL